MMPPGIQRSLWIILLFLPVISCSPPRSRRDISEVERLAVLGQLAALKASAVDAEALYQMCANLSDDQLKALKGKTLSVRGYIRNIDWEGGTPTVKLVSGPRGAGGVACAIRPRSPSVQMVKDHDYTSPIYLVGQVVAPFKVSLPWTQMVIVHLAECQVLF